MANQKSLVLVVGAGASKEANLPIGLELKSEIAGVLDIKFERGYQKISGDDYITEAFRAIVRDKNSLNGDINPYLNACWMIRDAMPQAASIDNFIDAHKDDPIIAEAGKLAIARCILNAEAKSIMRVDPGNIYNKMNFQALEKTWYTYFFRLLIENCQLSNIPERLSTIAIITFNYDRCIENYLHAALSNYYGIEADKATQLLCNLSIYHAYGSLGSLHTTNNQNSVHFGENPNVRKLISISKELKTFTEGTDETHSDIIEIRNTLKAASLVGFIGFAYNRQNLDLLYGPIGTPVTLQETVALGTAYGISTNDINAITNELYARAGYMKEKVQLRNDLTCAQFFQEYSRSLSISR